MNINDPVIRFVEDVLEKQQNISDKFLTEVEKRESELYLSDTNTFVLSLRELEDGDIWWADIAWKIIKERSDNPDDAFIGLLVRQYIERHIKRLARVQVEEDLLDEDFIY